MLNTDENANLSIKQIIANDIKKYSEEMNIPLREVVKDITLKSSVGLRTLERILDVNSNLRPYARTAAEIYAYLYGADSLLEVITKAPKLISEYIEKNHINLTRSQSVSDFSTNPSVQNELTKDSIFNQVYLMTGGDYGTDLATVRERFGVTGLRHLDEMLKHGFVKIDDERVTRGKRLTWNPAVRQNVAKTLMSEIYNGEEADLRPENYLGFFSGDVTPEDSLKVREIFARSTKEVMEVILNSRPTAKEAVRLNIASVVASIQSKTEGDYLC